MDFCNGARYPYDDELDSTCINIKYDGKKCLILQDSDDTDVSEAVLACGDTQILLVHKYRATVLPSNIKKLSDLQILVVTSGSLSQFPSFHFSSSLTLLDLSENSLTELPPDIADLQSLKVISLARNQLREIPEEFYSLAQLQSVDLGENRLTELSSSIWKLKGLQVLTCSGNKLTELPEEITCLSHLQILRLSNNGLSYLPRLFSNLTSLLTLQLDGNSFDHIPAQITQCHTLTELSISHNAIEGRLPKEVGKLANLRTLNLESNQFTELGSEVENLKKLEYLNLSNNRIRSISFTLSMCRSLQELDMSGCYLYSLPEDFGLLKELMLLKISNNRIAEFPTEITGFPKMTGLIASRNQFSALPPWVCSLDNLVELELHHNKLSSLPSDFGRLSNTLRQLDLAHNTFNEFPMCICQPDSRLTYLCLDWNPLKSVPEEISYLGNLTHLSISNCSFLTALPSGLGSCTNLRMLRACHCSLRSLPKSFSKLNSLKYLDLSHNDFHGFPIVVCYFERLRVLLYDQQEGTPLVTREDPKGWFVRSGLLYPESTMEKPREDLESLPSLTEDPKSVSLDEALEMEWDEDLGLPPLIGRLSQLVHLSVQSNGLFILPDVFHLMNIRRLNLSHNRLRALPPHFHKVPHLTHLYLHDNKFEYLEDSFQHLTKLEVLTLVENPLLYPPSEVCSDRKVFPVFLYLQQQKAFEDSVLRLMCLEVVRSLPQESAISFLDKIGFSSSLIEMLEKEYPGGYNYSKRMRLAMEVWAGLSLEEEHEEFVRPNLEAPVLAPPPPSESLSHSVDTHSDSAPATLTKKPLGESEEFGEDVRHPCAPETQSVHSVPVDTTLLTSYPRTNILLKDAISGPKASPQRLLHVVYLLGLPELHRILSTLYFRSRLTRF
ncbi:unnamed protein product [Calicophoron daubneyi]|uniref:Disease resistance R13L4/SHOC-2-like LRR domain-containing protein n=1 Tax=Calicophoron daubneyi TaxID=300641 RepID=A0AAV2TBW4_CALDB